MENKIDWIVASLGSIVMFMFGQIDTPIIVLFMFIGMDYLTGIVKAYLKKTLSSSYGLKGFLKKLVMLLIISMGVLLDKLTGASGVMRNFVIFYYLANEGLSILENIAECGIKIPNSLRNALEQLKKEE